MTGTDEQSRPGSGPRTTGERRLPGDPTPEQTVARMIRVDHAGEYGAVRIYAGQQAVLRHGPAAAAIDEMLRKEQEHLDGFGELAGERRVRPTALLPLWHVAGHALGVASALLGARAAMACTAAIEEVIDEHYAAQARELGDDEAALRDMIERYRADELDHRDTALAHEAALAPGHALLSDAVKAGSRLAIWLSTRL